MVELDIQIDKTTPIPLYYQLKEAILNNIKDGTYPQGGMVSKEQDPQHKADRIEDHHCFQACGRKFEDPARRRSDLSVPPTFCR